MQQAKAELQTAQPLAAIGAGDSLEGDADDVAQDDNSGGGQAGGDLLAHKVVEGGVRGNLGVLPRALAHHINGCSTQPVIHILQRTSWDSAQPARPLCQRCKRRRAVSRKDVCVVLWSAAEEQPHGQDTASRRKSSDVTYQVGAAAHSCSKQQNAQHALFMGCTGGCGCPCPYRCKYSPATR